jgi:hypothetical protein
LPEVDVKIETERPGGWSYEVQVRHEDGRASEHLVRLSWADHDYWSGGASPPSRVVQAVLEYLVRHFARPLPARFDAGKARWWAPGIDAEMKGPA